MLIIKINTMKIKSSKPTLSDVAQQKYLNDQVTSLEANTIVYTLVGGRYQCLYIQLGLFLSIK